MKIKSLLLLLLLCSVNIYSQIDINKILNQSGTIKPKQLTEKQQFRNIIHFILQYYGKSFRYYDDIKAGRYEFAENNGKKKGNYNLKIYEAGLTKRIMAELELSNSVYYGSNASIFFNKGEIEKYINYNTFNNSYLGGSKLIDLKITDNILFDRMILKNDNIASYYWRILNKDFALHNLVDQFNEPAELFKNIESGTIIPYGTEFNNSKILTIDSDFESIIYFDGNLLNHSGESVNKVFGRGGIGFAQFTNPTGITQGRVNEGEDHDICAIYIADQYNFRIGIVDFIIDPNNSELSYVDSSSYRNFKMIYPYDLSYFKSLTNADDDKLWVSEVNPFTPRLTCVATDGTKIQTIIGYLDSNTNQIYLFEAGTKPRLNIFNEGFGAISFIDNIRNVLVSCVLKSDGTAFTIPYGNKTLILANDLLYFPNNESINSVSFQSTNVYNSVWPTLWVTSENKMHGIKMNARAHTQYLGSTSSPNNSTSGFHYLKNTITATGIVDLITIEDWSSNNYGIRKYAPYVDFYNDTLYNYCEDSINIVRWKGIMTNDCFIYMRPQRKKINGSWETIKIKKINGIDVNDTCYVKWQLAGWNQASSDLYIDLQLDLPMEDYALGGDVRLYLGFYPEYNYPNTNDPNFWDLMHENKTYESHVNRNLK